MSDDDDEGGAGGDDDGDADAGRWQVMGSGQKKESARPDQVVATKSAVPSPGVETGRRVAPPRSLPLVPPDPGQPSSPVSLGSLLAAVSQHQSSPLAGNAGLPFFPLVSASTDRRSVNMVDVGTQIPSLKSPAELLTYATELRRACQQPDDNTEALEQAVDFLRKFAEHVCATGSSRTTSSASSEEKTDSSTSTSTATSDGTPDIGGGRDDCQKACGIRPKSFLREEMDEFDRIFSELLNFSPQKRISQYLSQADDGRSDDVKEPGVVTSDEQTEYSGANPSNMECEHCKNVIGARAYDLGARSCDCCRSSAGHVKGATQCSRCVTATKQFCEADPCLCGRFLPGAAGNRQSGSADMASGDGVRRPDTESAGPDGRAAWHRTLWDESDRLFFQLLDDLDDLTGDTASVRRRKKAREMFSNWLFSEDPKNADSPARKYRDAFRDLTRSRSEEASDSRQTVFTRWRPRSFEYLSEDDTDSGYHTGSSTLQSRGQKNVKKPPGQWTLTREELRRNIELFNNNNHGLIMSLQPDTNTFQGFIRVHLNLIRPINMSLSARPPSIYDVIGQGEEESGDDDNQITSFYLPKDTTKVIHISSNTTAQEVIKALLSKFKITDNPRKFALYEKIIEDDKATMRRLEDDELPLVLCLSWTKDGVDGLDKRQFVVQENDTGEIMWEAFSVPELENFLRILNREEEEYVEQVRKKYRMVKIHMERRLKELCPQDTAVSEEQRTPVFV